MRGLLLAVELRRWRAAGHRPVLWWRDDDAREDTPALRRLLALSAETGVPLTIAAIPDGVRASLAQPLSIARDVTLVQHGNDHQNRMVEGGSAEFALDTPADMVAESLAQGWSRIAALPGAMKVFVPPWNAVHTALPGALAALGYRGWSAWARTEVDGAPPRIDAHLDVLRWKGGARFRGAGAVLARLARLLSERRRAGLWDAPVGLLTHHLDHDAAAWAFLDGFVARRDFDWRSLPALLAAAT